MDRASISQACEQLLFCARQRLHKSCAKSYLPCIIKTKKKEEKKKTCSDTYADEEAETIIFYFQQYLGVKIITKEHTLG